MPVVADATLAMGQGRNETNVTGAIKPAGPKPTRTAPKLSKGNVVIVQASVTLIVGLATLCTFTF